MLTIQVLAAEHHCNVIWFLTLGQISSNIGAYLYKYLINGETITEILNLNSSNLFSNACCTTLTVGEYKDISQYICSFSLKYCLCN